MGGASIAWFTLSFFLCYPVAFIFIWRSAWRFTIAALVGPGIVYSILQAAGITPQDLRR